MSRAAKKKVNIAPVGMLILFGGTALSQVKLQVFEKQKTIDLANDVRKYEVTKTTRAKRGTIQTADGKPLAQDWKQWRLQVDLGKVPHTPGFAIALSEASGIPAHEFADQQKGGRDWSITLSEFQMSKVAQVKKDFDAAGITLTELAARNYPLSALASGLVGRQHVSGKEGENVQRFGLEASLNNILGGRDGKQTGLQDKNGEFLPMRSESPEVVKQDGAKVVTTIDSEIQAAASLSVRRAVERNRATSGVAVVTDPKTGDVLAVASWPAVDPNEQGLSPIDGKNPAYTNLLEPGSTFKILTLTKAVSDGTISEGQLVNCSGQLMIGSRARIRCDEHHGNRAHGTVDPALAIAKSCNVAAATWSQSIGVDGFFEYIQELGLQSPTGLDLQGEIRSRANRDKGNPALQLANLGFGQAMSVTPIALAGAFGAIGNDGNRVPLRLVKSVNGIERPIRGGKQILSKQSCDYTLECMERVMSSVGTGSTLRIPGYRLGGKTGTAQKFSKGQNRGYVSNFVGMIPARNPQAVILVMIDDPKAGKIYGADVAGPVFKDVAKSVITRLNIPREQ
ncbi:MAG: penicillin-binding protein 2 [Armatimonadota bacterium]